MEEENFFDAPAEAAPVTKPPARRILESEELDFTSLIQPKKKELPKGLSKPTTTVKANVVTSPRVPVKATITKPVIGSGATVKKAATTTTNSIAKKPVTAATKKPVVAKTEGKDGWGNDDGWGEGW